jgi:RNA recognition motif-containing protein
VHFLNLANLANYTRFRKEQVCVHAPFLSLLEEVKGRVRNDSAFLATLKWSKIFIKKRKKSKKRRIIMNIYVGNLSSDVTDEAIREAFVSFGQVTSARVIKDKYTGQSRCFGFVEMAMQSQAQTAIKSLNGKELMGKEISVSEARPRRDEGRTGGGRMDYSGSRNRY